MTETSWDVPMSSVEALIKEVEAEREPVSPLAHYTTLDATIGILTTKSLWLTLCDYMNDPLERRYGMQLLIDEVAQHDHQNARIRGICASLSKWLSSFVDDDGNYVFLLSVSKAHDLLSQWRAYADNGDGCSIILAATGIPDGQAPHGLLHVPVVYGRATQQSLIRRGLKLVLDAAEVALDDGIEATIVHNGVGRALHRWGIFCSLILKQPAFAEEQEWRFIAITDMSQPALNICEFRRAKAGVAPYFTWDLGENFSKIVTEVRLGPRAASAANERSLRWLLDKYGYNSTKVTCSSASIR